MRYEHASSLVSLQRREARRIACNCRRIPDCAQLKDERTYMSFQKLNGAEFEELNGVLCSYALNERKPIWSSFW
jgi:hypothetical protein